LKKEKVNILVYPIKTLITITRKEQLQIEKGFFNSCSMVRKDRVRKDKNLNIFIKALG